MIELFGSIASILGFAMQLDQNANEGNDDSAIAFSGLIAISESSRSWKSLHSVYHPLERNFDGIISEISEYRNGRFVPKNPDYVNAGVLREHFFDGTVNTLVSSFSSRTNRDVKYIMSSLDLDKQEVVTSLNTIRGIDSHISNDFEDLCERKNEAMEIHQRFAEFLSHLKKFIGEPKWDESHVKYLLDNRQLLSTDLHNMIYITDRVLMGFLDIYMRVVNNYAQTRGINTVRI